MDKERFKKFQKVIKEMQDSKGYKLDSAAYQLESSFIMTVVNFGELKRLLEDVPTFSVKQKRMGESRKFQIHALRLFANYLASATAFRDHTRCFVKRIYGSVKKALDGKYQKEVNKKFKENNLSQFIEDIRNFQQHYKPLPISILSKVKDGTFYSRIVLGKETLLESGYEWTKGKRFLNNAKDHIDVSQISENYLYKTIFPWIIQQQAKYHKQEFEEFKHLQEMARKIYYDK
jgi:hypothetical protein